MLAGVKVERVGAGALGVARRWGVDVAAEVAHARAAVEVVGPEAAVDEAHVLHGDVLRVGDVYQPGAQRLEVGALREHLAAQPELVVEAASVAVDGAAAGDGEAVHAVGVDERGEVVERLALQAGLHDLVVGDGVAALEARPLHEVQVGAGAEEERAGEERASRHHHHAPALGCGGVDDALYGLGLEHGGVVLHAVVGYYVLAAQGAHVHLGGVGEPCVHGRAVGPELLFLLGAGRRGGHYQQRGGDDCSCLHLCLWCFSL